jgi:VIT1/CCC1 family predicted Fe2+/Mn2+ transporter
MNLGRFDARYLKAMVFGANDGIITTFAVVAGVMGAGLSPRIILILGVANMMADGVSMGIGDYLGEKSARQLQKARHENVSRDGVWHTGLITFVAFVVAGSLPLLPFLVQFLYSLSWPVGVQFSWSIAATAMAMFLVGSLRSFVTGLEKRWWRNGLEVLAIGAIAAGVAYGLGYLVEMLVG